MSPELVIHIMIQAVAAVFWISAPLLFLSFALGIVVNLVQIATSMQDPIFGTVPRLAACLGGLLLFLPWMIRHATTYAISILGNLQQYAR